MGMFDEIMQDMVKETVHYAATSMMSPLLPSQAVQNDGGVVATLFLSVAVIALYFFGAVAWYASVSGNVRSLPRLLSGWANCGNATAHALLVVYTMANSTKDSQHWGRGGGNGPIVLMVINLSVGLLALRNGVMVPAAIWNVLVAVLGSFIVWPRFLDQGLTTWPYAAVFIWFVIFFMGLTALVASVTHFVALRHFAALRRWAD